MKSPLPSVVLGLLPVMLSAAAASTSPAARTSPPDFHLFVGVNMAVAVDGKYYDVVDAGNRSVVVMIDHKPREIPLNRAKDMMIHRGLKLTNATATIADVEGLLTSDAAEADRRENVMNSMALSMTNDMQRDHVQGQIVTDTMLTAAAYNAYHWLPGPGTLAAAQKAEQQVNQDISQFATQEPTRERVTDVNQDLMRRTMTDDTNQGDGIEITPTVSSVSAQLAVSGKAAPGAGAAGAPGSAAAKPGNGAAQNTTGPRTVETTTGVARAAAPPRVRNAAGDRADHFTLSFDLSAPQPIENPYVVLITEYSAPKSGNQVFRRILTKSLREIGPKSQKVEMYQTGFPTGFQLRQYSLAVYSHTQELATNLSERDVPLTADEAYQYVVLDYLSSHKGETHPPAAVLMASRDELRREFDAAQLSQPVYVAVDKSGNVARVSADENGRRPAPPAIADALQSFRFIPALSKGTPTDGHARLILADFIR